MALFALGNALKAYFMVGGSIGTVVFGSNLITGKYIYEERDPEEYSVAPFATIKYIAPYEITIKNIVGISASKGVLGGLGFPGLFLGPFNELVLGGEDYTSDWFALRAVKKQN
jgi:hypothetical protein